MPGVARKPDMTSSSGMMGPSINLTASLDTYANNLRILRFGDIVLSIPIGYHCGVHNVYVNNRCIQCCGDLISNGTMQIECSSDVIVGISK